MLAPHNHLFSLKKKTETQREPEQIQDGARGVRRDRGRTGRQGAEKFLLNSIEKGGGKHIKQGDE